MIFRVLFTYCLAEPLLDVFTCGWVHIGYGMCLETEDNLGACVHYGSLLTVFCELYHSSPSCPHRNSEIKLCATTSGFLQVLGSKRRSSCMHALCQLEICSQKLRTEFPLDLILLGLLASLNLFLECLQQLSKAMSCPDASAH